MRLTDLFPPIPRVTRLTVARPDTSQEGIDFWVWFRSLQGLVNRIEPHLYVVRTDPDPRVGDFQEEHWLEYYRREFKLPAEGITGADAVLDRYRSAFSGYILYDNEDVIQTQNLAITRCGLEGLLPVSPDQEKYMIRHGIPKRDDLRGRFKTGVDAAEWALENLWPYCNRRFFANFCVHRPIWPSQSHELEDFVVSLRGLALDLPLSRQSRRTRALYRTMLESAEKPGVQMNWHCACDQEKEFVAEAAEFGFLTLCSVYTPNLTVHGGIGEPLDAYEQPLPSAEECRAEKDKVYVCLYNSDGDATWAMHNLHSQNWLAPERGRFKFGWGILPLMVKLMPGMLRYYHQTRGENDCFWGPSSGAGYTYTQLWPKDLVDGYLAESRQLLDQTGQHGCNMVNWFLRDWWREVEDDEAIRREQEALKSGPGLVCGLGGSPFAKSYLDGPIPKVHSVHIANVGRDNIGDIVKLSQECPTRPLFLFLFAQIAPGIWQQVESELEEYARHPEIQLCSMDEFFLTLQDAIQQGHVGEELYEKTDGLSETWLKAPGRHRLPLCEKIAAELAQVVRVGSTERRRILAEAAWIDLVSCEIENVAQDRDEFLAKYAGRAPVPEEEEADTLLYVAFTVAWTVVRSAIEAQGIYANHRTQCLDDFKRLCGTIVDTAAFEGLFQAWENWEQGSPDATTLAKWVDGIAGAARRLRDALGPDEAETFTNWPPRTI